VRVALIGPVPPRLGGATPGGVATHQVDLAAGLAAAGVYAPLLATNARQGRVDPHPPSPPLPETGRGGSDLFPIFFVGRGWTSFHRLPTYALFLTRSRVRGSRREVLRNLVWYRRFLSSVRPELIHVQHPLERCLYTRMVQHLEGWRVPLVVTAHSLFGEHAEDTIYSLMAPNLRAADRVIAVSEHIAEQAVQLGVAGDRVRVIRSGVDVERFRPRDRHPARRRLGINAEVPVVLFVGNLEPRKQVDVLLRAMRCVRQRVPRARLLIVGSGQGAGAEDQTDRLVGLSRDLDLAEAVSFVGPVDDQQLLDHYAAANVFALASSSEAQGIVALEAMACGLPVVASAVGGLLGAIDDGRTGFLVPPGDSMPLAQRLIDVLQDGHRAATIGIAARQSVERDFSWPRTVEATIQVYREALAARPKTWREP
jgi:glycosyltransferase involved in cell wall biosynthesis